MRPPFPVPFPMGMMMGGEEEWEEEGEEEENEDGAKKIQEYYSNIHITYLFNFLDYFYFDFKEKFNVFLSAFCHSYIRIS